MLLFSNLFPSLLKIRYIANKAQRLRHKLRKNGANRLPLRRLIVIILL